MLEDNSVTGAIVSSPPYFRQRVFTANGTVKTSSNGATELGQELEVQDYVENLCVILAECARVLSPTASFYLNMGDTYQEGNLLNVPARVSIAVQDKLGLILKQTLVSGEFRRELEAAHRAGITGGYLGLWIVLVAVYAAGH